MPESSSKNIQLGIVYFIQDVVALFHVWFKLTNNSKMQIIDLQLSRQKIRQKISEIITNTKPPLQTLLFS